MGATPAATPIGGARGPGRRRRRIRAAAPVLALVAVVALLAPTPVVGGRAPAAAAAASVERSESRAAVEARCRRKPSRCLRIGVGEPIVIGTLLDETQPLGREPLVSVELAIDYLDGTFDGVDGSLLGHRWC